MVAELSQIRQIPSLVGAIKPLPAWLPSGWESPFFPLLDDVESVRQWLRHSADSIRRLSDPATHTYLIDGDFEFVEVRDCYRLVRHLATTRGLRNPPAEPARRYRVPDDAMEATSEIEKVCAWISSTPAINQRGGQPAGDNERLSVPELAKRWGLNERQKNALSTRLFRWRADAASSDYDEVKNAAKNQPTYLYRVGAIRRILDGFAPRKM